MNTLAQQLLKNFDDLPETEQQAILLRRRFANAIEILKRAIDFDVPPLTDEDLVLNAEELFLALDKQ
jgi:hypothetical protein